MKLTNDFSLHEFLESRFFNEAEKKRVQESYDENKFELEPNLITLVDNLQTLRYHLGARIDINISYRPKWYELSRGRSGKSQHVQLKAADISVIGWTPGDVANEIEALIKAGKMTEGGVGRYKTFTHYDIRGTAARWNG
tara:strand:- start:263 stop:679 length:417 start_codon:yes stop_codon:yes gene_type:complete